MDHHHQEPFENATIVDNAHHVDVRNLYSKDALSVSVITLQPGESLKRHMTPADVVFYVLAGRRRGAVEIGDEQEHVGPDALVESPEGIMHCWHSTSEELLRFYVVIKAPRPTRKTVFLSSVRGGEDNHDREQSELGLFGPAGLH